MVNLTDELFIRAEITEIRRASAWLESTGSAYGIPPDHIYRLDICLNEALANIFSHAGDEASSAPIGLHLYFTNSQLHNEFTLTVSDAGKPYDPIAAEKKPRPTKLEDTEPGGLGVLMMEKFSDVLYYNYRDGRNLLTFGVRWSGAANGEGSSFQVQPIHSLSLKRRPERRVSNTLTTEDRRRITRRGIGLGWIPLFRGVEENLILDAINNSEILLLSAGATLMNPGDINTYVYILLSGRVHAYLDATFQQESAIEIPLGECIGEISMIDGKPVSAKIATETDAYLLKLSREIFWGRLMTMPGVASNLLVGFTERMRRTNDIALQGQREQLELSHLRKELDVARQLQISMLPLQRPLFLDRHEIDACGSMEPTSNVGGDLFDAFFVGDKTLFFCIGDVSGHGIAAALFMARTIGLLRILAMNYKKPAKLLEMLNERLCVGNDTNLFVTLFCGFLNVKTGVMNYSNAGHCTPIIISEGKSTILEIPKGVLAGVFSGLKYKAMKCTLNRGDTIFCYTDGVTEAQNPEGEDFTEERCKEFLDHSATMPLPDMLDAMRQEVIAFTQTKTLDDDCTMIALRLNALPPKRAHL